MAGLLLISKRREVLLESLCTSMSSPDIMVMSIHWSEDLTREWIRSKQRIFASVVWSMESYSLEGEVFELQVFREECLAIYVGYEQSEGSNSNEPAACIDAKRKCLDTYFSQRTGLY